MDGAWWGGGYGWRWPHGAHQILEAVAIACTNGVLLGGTLSQLDLIRSQLDTLWDLGHEADSGAGGWLVPHRHVNSGWTDYRRPDARVPVACWSLNDMRRRISNRVLRLPGSAEWGTPTGRIAKANGAANSEHWFAYVHGANPDYPAQILATNQRQLHERLDRIRSDDGDPAEWDVHHWQDMSPVFAEGLVQTMLGAPLHVYHGGLQFATVRYFDHTARRPGLPPDVAALVERRRRLLGHRAPGQLRGRRMARSRRPGRWVRRHHLSPSPC